MCLRHAQHTPASKNLTQDPLKGCSFSMTYILSNEQRTAAATAMSVGVTHSPQTLNNHTFFISVLHSIILYLQSGLECVPVSALVVVVACGLRPKYEGTRRRLLSGGTKRDAERQRKHTKASIWFHSHTLEILTHTQKGTTQLSQ